jgi:feruloyl esterase
MKAAQSFPEDFHGIVAGAPAFDFSSLISWSGNFFRITGPAGSPSFLTPAQWSLVHKEVMRQCDHLDGVVDGIIEDNDLCYPRPEALICAPGITTECITPKQAETVRRILSPLYGSDGEEIYPRMNPGSEEGASVAMYNGQPFAFTQDWYRYVIYNDSSWDPSTLSLKDMKTAGNINAADSDTWDADLSPFQRSGGKLLTYHGQQDQLISSENSARYYNLLSRTMGLPSSSLDQFYRYFRIPGMGHCAGGPGAWNIGQTAGELDDDPRENIVVALIKWVEEGTPPETVMGAKYVADVKALGTSFRRRHCRYPLRNTYDGKGDHKSPESWSCT